MSITPERATGLAPVPKWGYGDKTADTGLEDKTPLQAAMGIEPAATPPPPAPAPVVPPGMGGSGPVPVAQGQKVGVKESFSGRVPSGEEGAITAGYKKMEKGYAEEARLKQQQANEVVALQQEHEAKRAVVQEAWNKELQANQAKADAMFDSISKAEIDPNGLWNNSSTGSKVAASIGMILGGISQGMIGGENQALKVVQAAIERDVDAQKANLGKKNTLLNHYIQKGHDLQTSRQLAIADYNTMAAGQMAMVANKYAGSTASADLLKESGKLQAAAAQARLAAGLHTAQLKSAQLDLDYKQKLLSGAGGVQGDPKLLIPNVNGIQGNHMYALRDSDASEVRKLNASNQTALGLIDDMTKLRKAYGAEILPAKLSQAKKEMKSLVADYTTAYSHANGLGALDRGTQDLVDEILGNPSDVGAVLNNLEKLRARTQRAFNNTIRSYVDPRLSGQQSSLQTLRQEGG